MNPLADRGNLPRAIVILEGLHRTEMSAANITDAIRALSASFSLTVLTSDPSECREAFPQARIIELPRARIRGGWFIFCVECWFLLPFLKGDLIYVAAVEHLPSVVPAFGRPVMCYGNCHPAQQIINTGRKGGRVSLLLSQINRAATRLGLRRCDLVLSVSPQLAEVYRSYGVSPSRIKEIGIGVPLQSYEPREARPPPSPSRIWRGIYHGVVSMERGLSIMIDGAAKLAQRRRDFRMRLVGCDNETAGTVHQLAREAGVEDLFEILPPVPHKDIPSLLWSADFGISLLEPNVYFSASPPVKVVEFLAAGLPVIANDLPTHRLYLEDKVNSILIAFDADSFAEAVSAMMEDRGLRDRLSGGALNSARKFSDEGVHRAIAESAMQLIGE